MRLLDDAGDQIVVMRLGNLGAVEGAGDERFVGAEVVDEDLAVDLRRVENRTTLPEQIGLFALAFNQQIDFAANPLSLFARADFLLQLHQLAAAGFDGALRHLLVERERASALLIGVAEDTEPVDLGLLNEG